MVERISEIYSLLVPLLDGRLIIPRSCVAEVVGFQDPSEMPGAPPWYLGMFAWGSRQIPLISFEGATDADHSANPPARTTIVTLPPGTPESVKRPSGPVTVCNSGPLVPSTLIDAPETAPPASSRTTPETADWAAAALARARERMSTKAVRMIAPY